MPIKTLYLIRHGQTDWNVQRKMQGHTNIPLNELGRAQARSIQDFFLRNPVDQVFSSDLDRAFQTAQIATSSQNIIKLESFREVHLGAIEGRTEHEILSQYGSEAWQKWISLEPQADYAFPGGETHKQSLKRVLDNLQHLFLQYEFQKAAICTHGLLIRRLAHHLRPDYTELLPIPNCGIYELRWEDSQIHFHGIIFDPSVGR
jgi:broad specificity phosphatase PhoE